SPRRTGNTTGYTAFPTRRSSDLVSETPLPGATAGCGCTSCAPCVVEGSLPPDVRTRPTLRERVAGVFSKDPAPGTTVVVSETPRSEEHTSELQSRENLVCRLLLE